MWLFYSKAVGSRVEIKCHGENLTSNRDALHGDRRSVGKVRYEYKELSTKG